ncbi:MFS transporter [Nitrogeniibacter aestuarii]|uniref:MFS transporter n=1 Tax=Nitrogeniibacter aestuarii TaxID=2815343 RepID=UPI001D0FEEAE|nr:MFS transporter [Nitrogeniibacter aestuarii]
MNVGMPVAGRREGSPAPLIAIGAVTSVEFVETGMVMFSADSIAAGAAVDEQALAFSFTLYGVAAIFMLFQHQWMVERLGYRRFVLLSLGVFALGGLLCAVADGVVAFSVGRLLQGLAGATFFTAGRMMINDLPPGRRTAGLLVFVGSLLAGSAAAPLLAAGLLAVGGWRALFCFPVLQALCVAWVAAGHLSHRVAPPESRSTEHWGWLTWLALGVFGLQLVIHDIPHAGSDVPARALWIGLGSVAILALFTWRQWQLEQPLINTRALWQARYLMGIALYFTGYGMIGAIGYLLPMYLHRGLGFALFDTAILVSVSLGASVLTALVHICVAHRWPWHRVYMVAGLALYALGTLALMRPEAHPTGWDLLPGVLATGVAIPLFIGPVAFGTFSELHASVFSHAYQIKNVVRQFGLSSSVAMASLFLQVLAIEPSQRPAWAWVLSRASESLGPDPGGDPLRAGVSALFIMLAVATVPAGIVVIVQRPLR